jgi:hypothetical protein
MRKLCIVLLLLPVVGSMATAQTGETPPAWPVSVGSRVLTILPESGQDERFMGVRIRSRLVGDVIGVSADTLYIQPHPDVGAVAIPRRAAGSLYTSRGRSRWRSAISYGVTGALVGVVWGNAMYDFGPHSSRADVIGTHALMAAGAGIFTGLLWPRESWRSAR